VNFYAHVVEQGGDEVAAMTGLAKIGRDNARTPMQWDAGPNGGFTTGVPWLPVNPNHTWLNAETQVTATDSVFAHYRALIELRHQLPILRDGVFTPLLEEDPELWAYTRTIPTEALIVLANCGRNQRVIDIDPEWTGARLLLGNLPNTPATIESGTLGLAAWDARIYLRQLHPTKGRS
jgi:oligo-1,6-glucosidase